MTRCSHSYSAGVPNSWISAWSWVISSCWPFYSKSTDITVHFPFNFKPNVSTRFSYFICGKGGWPSVYCIFERCKRTHSSRSSAILSPIWNLPRLHTYFDYKVILCGVCVRNNDVIRIGLDFNSIFLFPIYEYYDLNMNQVVYKPYKMQYMKWEKWCGVGCGTRKFGTGTRRDIFLYLVCANRRRRRRWRRRRRSNKFLFWYLFIFYRSCIWTVLVFFIWFIHLPFQEVFYCVSPPTIAGMPAREWYGLESSWVGQIRWRAISWRFHSSQAIRWDTHDIHAIINCRHIFSTEYNFRTLSYTKR